MVGAFGPIVAKAGIITGTVFVDSNYGGGTSLPYDAAVAGMSLRQGVTVEIYRQSDNAYITSVLTDAAGVYSYDLANPTAENYTARVVCATVTSPLSASSAAVLAVPIYNGTTNSVGGANPRLVDAGAHAGSQTLASLNTATTVAQAVATVLVPATGTAPAADFGFNFDVIVNTNDAGQGSLRQFILNSNAQANNATTLDQRPFNSDGIATGPDFPAGQETSIFMLADGTARPGTNSTYANLLTDASGTAAVTNSRALLTLTSATLPISTDAATALDGTTQTTLSNSNPVLLGTGGRVGVGSLLANGSTAGPGGQPLSQVNGPEVELTGGTAGYNLLQVTGNGAIVRGLAINGTATAVTTSTGTAMLLEGNIIGMTAFSGSAAAANEVRNEGMLLLNPSGTVRNNLIGYCGTSGVSYSGQGAGYSISNNEIYRNGYVTAGGDNITIGDYQNLRGAAVGQVAGPLVITGNLLVYANSSGIQLEIGRLSNNIITNNTIQNNGKAGASSRLEGSGIHYLLRAGSEVSANTDLIQGNVLSSNQSSAIVINYGQKNVQITRNSIFSNGDNTTGGAGLIAIDLTPATYYVGSSDATGRVAYGQGDGVTPNDGKTIDAQGSRGIDYPVITSVTKASDGNLSVTGYIGKAAQSGAANTPLPGNSAFAGATVEIFSANDDSNNQGMVSDDAPDATYNPTVDHGEAQNYLGTLTADAAGNFSGTFAVASTLNVGDKVTATAYLAGYGTSEVGANLKSTVAVPLPVELTRFRAQAQGLTAALDWATASEMNNQYFAVERSADGQHFTQIGTVASAGTSSLPQAYQYVDAGAARVSQLVYYRLRQVDKNQQVAFSPVQAVAFGTALATPTLAPNPATGQTLLDLSGLATTLHSVALLDLTGRTVRRFELAGGQPQALTLQGLAAGVYLVRLAEVASPLRLVIAE